MIFVSKKFLELNDEQLKKINGGKAKSSGSSGVSGSSGDSTSSTISSIASLAVQFGEKANPAINVIQNTVKNTEYHYNPSPSPSPDSYKPATSNNTKSINSKKESSDSDNKTNKTNETNQTNQTDQTNVRDDPWGIYAIKDGIVVQVRKDDNKSAAYGNTVIIKDKDGLFVRYAHMESTPLEKGDVVKEGEKIGIMGDTGTGLPKSNKHLHVSVYPQNASSGFWSKEATIDPTLYIAGGTYPCNTYISTAFKAPLVGTNGVPYYHEGTDFSGQTKNQIAGWQNGLPGASTILLNK